MTEAEVLPHKRSPLYDALVDSAPKRYRRGTHRGRTPPETLEGLRPHLAAMGITRIANVTGLDRIGVPVVMVCRPNSRSLATSQGKGADLDAAKVSGLMEAIELYHAEHVLLPLKLACEAELRYSHPVVDTSQLASIANSRFHPQLDLLWVEAVDLVAQEPLWLPYEIVHVSARVPVPTGSGCFASTSNGLASGNSLPEALLHGICEVVERDAVAVWKAAGADGRRGTRLDLESVDDPDVVEVLERCRDAGVEAAAWETTSDIGIPAFFCEIVDEPDNVPRVPGGFSGMGCHPARGIALLRALTEAIQSRLTVISGSRDDLFRREYWSDDGLPPGSLGSHAPLDGPLRRFTDVPTGAGDTLDEDLRWVLERLKVAGYGTVAAVDLTKPAPGIPVVRVIVPGLEGPSDDPEYRRGARAAAAAASA
jgi:ribosomal protein S12 methylthiotransferase accessory factor